MDGLDSNLFRFFDLPSEIRLKIYQHFFSGQPRSITYLYRHPFNLIDERHWNLLLVSKRVYHEALPHYYQTCLFGTFTLNGPHLQKLIENMAGTFFAQHVRHLMVWKVPDLNLFKTFHNVKWVKLLGITCGVEPDSSNGQIFTYNSLMKALEKSRVPGFSWKRCQDLFQEYNAINFMVDLRCDFWEIKMDACGDPQRRWIKTSFVYDVRADEFVEETRGTNKQDGLVLRSHEASNVSRKYPRSSCSLEAGLDVHMGSHIVPLSMTTLARMFQTLDE